MSLKTHTAAAPIGNPRFTASSMVLLAVVIYVATSRRGAAEAYLLNPYEQAIGSWDVSLRPGGWWDPGRGAESSPRCRRLWSALFPLAPPPPQSDADAEADDGGNGQTAGSARKREESNRDSQEIGLVDARRRRDCESGAVVGRGGSGRSRTVQCELILAQDGTFSLAPRCGDEGGALPPLSLPSRSNGDRLPLRGEWYLHPNPYCVTDRQYDELTLVSNPRVRRGGSGERAMVELHCRVWGRYGMKSVRDVLGLQHGRVRSRITHGTVVLRRTAPAGSGSPRGVVCGTFSGRAAGDGLGMSAGRWANDMQMHSNEDEDDLNDDAFHDF